MSIVNCYEKIKCEKPHYDPFGLEIPFRMCILAPSGGGKNNIFMNLLHEWQNIFDKVIIVAKMLDQPIFKYIRENCEDDWIEFTDKTPSPEELSGDENKLLVLDDQILEVDKKSGNKQNNDKQFVFGRHNKTSIVFLSQIYGGKDGLSAAVRRNLTAVLMKAPKTSDRDTLRKDLDLTKEEIQECEDNWVLVNRNLSSKDNNRVKILE